jgi:hypothetical protein
MRTLCQFINREQYIVKYQHIKKYYDQTGVVVLEQKRKKKSVRELFLI